jgi:CheY-like chemotaxis protein
MLYQHTLEKGGFSVRLARSGKQALELIEKEKPVAILTDINMPEMSGFELARKVKDGDTTRDIIVVLLTTTFSPESIFDCINSGADEISLKGLKDQALVELMESSINRRVEVSPGAVAVEAKVSLGGSTPVAIKSDSVQNLRLLLSLYDLMRKMQEN